MIATLKVVLNITHDIIECDEEELFVFFLNFIVFCSVRRKSSKIFNGSFKREFFFPFSSKMVVRTVAEVVEINPLFDCIQLTRWFILLILII